MARSKLEEDLDDALRKLFPHDRIKEDMPIKVRGKTLYVDRIIAGAKIAIEADGRQHFEFVAHFHKDAEGFKSHVERDRVKAEWLEQNGYTLVRISYAEEITFESVRRKILDALKAEAR